jgi:hypothetical protein
MLNWVETSVYGCVLPVAITLVGLINYRFPSIFAVDTFFEYLTSNYETNYLYSYKATIEGLAV